MILTVVTTPLIITKSTEARIHDFALFLRVLIQAL